MDYTKLIYTIQFYGEEVKEWDDNLSYEEMMKKKDAYMRRGLRIEEDFYIIIK